MFKFINKLIVDLIIKNNLVNSNLGIFPEGILVDKLPEESKEEKKESPSQE